MISIRHIITHTICKRTRAMFTTNIHQLLEVNILQKQKFWNRFRSQPFIWNYNITEAIFSL